MSSTAARRATSSVYISASELKRLDSYAYSGVDHSILSKLIMQRYWTWLVQLMPLWIAPNMITLLGLGAVLVNLATLTLFSSGDLTAPCPPWVYATFSAGIFIYTSLDAIDGKQARRTATSSPLGELFDHGVDALNTTLGCIMLSHTLGMADYLPWFLLASFAYFYVSTWETYHTGTLYLGPVNGPVEGTLFITLLYLFTAVVGPGFWVQPLPFAGGMPLNRALLPFPVIMFVVAMGSSMLRATKKASSSLLGLLPFILFATMAAIWFSFSPSRVAHSHPLVFCLILGLEFAIMVARVILAHLLHTPYPLLFPFMALMAPLTINSLLARSSPAAAWMGPGGEQTLTFAYALIISAVYLHLVLTVIQQFCTYLDINCLTIKHRTKGR